MTKNCSILFGCLILILQLGCRNENDIFPANARLKYVLWFNDLTSTVPVDTVEVYEYNKSGQISKISYKYNHDIYEYNSFGQLATITNWYVNRNSPTGYINLKTYSYTYSTAGKKIKETIKYPQINSSEYNLFFYEEDRLSRIENYGYREKPDVLLSYSLFEYDDYSQPLREVLYGFNDIPYRWTINTFTNGLKVKTEIFADVNFENTVRTINRTFDKNKNLKILETTEGPYSSGVGHSVYRYFY